MSALVERNGYKSDISPETRSPSLDFQQLMQASTSTLNPNARSFVGPSRASTIVARIPFYNEPFSRRDTNGLVNQLVKESGQGSTVTYKGIRDALRKHFNN
jgi:hypothetical protein